ncbi:MAG: Ig-like domain-containing protein [Acholeplasmataceae bacterium]|nr:Ig-like domain-containing protein [Acholeplasmataceae bacterium]
MFKRGVLSLSFLFVLFVLFSCGKEITVSVDDLAVTMKTGETYQIEVGANDSVVFESSDEDVLTISESGLVTALSVGSANVKVISKSDEAIFVTIVVTVESSVEITTTQSEYTLKTGETVDLSYTANSDVSLSSSDEAIFTISGDTITGVSEGVATLTITSTTDTTVFEEISVTVRKSIDLSVEETYIELWVGKTEQILFTSNDEVEFVISDSLIASVSSSGLLTGLDNGLVTIEVVSTYDDTVKETLTARVYNPAETLIISGNEIVNANTMMTLTADVGPDDAYEYVTWTSSDETVATVSETGILTALSSGMVTITATSMYDDALTDEIEIEVVNYLVVDETKESGSTLTYMGLDLSYGVDLFDTISAAAAQAVEGSTIYILAGTYQEDVTIDTQGVTLDGNDLAIIDGVVHIAADQVNLKNLSFNGQSQITNALNITGFVFSNNTVLNTTMSQNFIDLDTIFDVAILDNTFTTLAAGNAISIENYLGGLIEVKRNVINQANTGIKLIARDNYDSLTKVQIERNMISNVAIGIEINTLSANDIQDYLRFNAVSSYTNLALKANENHKMDVTLNYWGQATPNYADFENVTTYELRGYYSELSEIISEADYVEGQIVKIVPDEETIEIVIGDTYKVSFEILPVEVASGSVRYITSDSETLRIGGTGILNPVKSGEALLTILLSSDYSINAKIPVVITTTPGIELTPSSKMQNLLVGDSFTLDAMVFPYDISDEDVLFETDDALIATIDQEGVVSSQGAGVVTFTAKLISDPLVMQSFTVEFFSSLNDSNLLDLLTKNQVNYTESHEVTAYGTGYSYTVDLFESVSRYYFGDLEINQSKMIPVFNGIRPGEPMDDLPSGVTQYNPYNVYWVVVHDTANTSTGAGALSHANYLWNAYSAGTQLWVSWHFSIDDKDIYQHLPEIERGYHAGDGSTQPLQSSTYLGGGNRNGIGIETGVNDDSDLYRTWQRTAKLVAELLNRYNLPRENMKYHNDFSGKDCPRTLRNAGLIPLFEELADIEYIVENDFSDAEITFVSNNPEYLDETGRVIQQPDRAMTVSYTVTVDIDGVISSRTFYSYLPGTIH